MSLSQLVIVGSNGLNSNQYLPLAGKAVLTVTEANVQIPIRRAGSVTNLYTYVSANTSGTTANILFRKNGASSGPSVSYTSGQTGIKESTNKTSTIAAGDKCNYATTNSSPGLTLQVVGVSFSDNTSLNSTSILAVTSAVITSNPGNTYYNTPNGEWLQTTVEADTQVSLGKNATAQYMSVNLTANSGDFSSTFGSRVNGVNGNLSVVYTAAQTGLKEDTANSDSLSLGDNFNFFLTTNAGTGSISSTFQSCHLINTNAFFLNQISSTDGVAVSFNTTTYCGIGGDLVFTTTEANTQIRPRFSYQYSNLGVYVTANTIATSPTTVTFRANSINQAPTVSYAAAQTGLKNDNTNKFQVLSGTHKINYVVATPNTSGTITFTWIANMILDLTIFSRPVFAYQAVKRASFY